MKRQYGKAYKCESRKHKYPGATRFEYALRKGKKHEKIRKNYWMLCKGCHLIYDNCQGGKFYKGMKLSKERKAKISIQMKFLVLDRKRDKKGKFI